jgi:hypothetical protein
MRDQRGLLLWDLGQKRKAVEGWKGGSRQHLINTHSVVVIRFLLSGRWARERVSGCRFRQSPLPDDG